MDKSGLIRKGIMIILTLFVIIYVIYVIGSASFTQVKTMTAKETEVYDEVNVKGFMVRDETLIDYDGEGIISYAVEDGEKVSVGQAVAGVYDSVASAGTTQELKKIDAQIEALTRLQTNAETLTQTPDEIDGNISDNLIQIRLALNSGDLTGAEGFSDDILYNINERQLLTGKTTDYSDKIKELEAKRDELKKTVSTGKKSKEINSKTAGYFVSYADGYENAIPTEKLTELMPEDLDSDNIKAVSVSDKTVGKTIDGVTWYVACRVSAEDALKIKNADRLKLDIPVVSNEKIKVDLYSINQKSQSEDAVIILSGTYMNREMSRLRREDISIILETYTGLYIPKSAVHESELTRTVEDESGEEKEEKQTVPGVYIKIGNEVLFKQISIIYSGEDYVVSSLDKDEETFTDDVGMLQAYDEIIVEGANLYDGKIISRNA